MPDINENGLDGFNEYMTTENIIDEPTEYVFDPENSNLVWFAKRELDAIGLTENSEDEMNVMMRKHVLHMVTEFAREGHSGFSAGYAISILTKLFNFKPLSPLSGDNDEWIEVSDNLWQNIRCSSVFKDETDKAWNIDARVFYDWNSDEKTGERYKSYFTNYFSRIPVEFPYVTPDKPIYEEWTEEWEKKRDEKFKAV